ncbi:MAG: hypothetical protein IRY90_17880 [Actinomadura rubrobrunea]|nr:hypothetical protein [Actinomadura rubrobrunea]
MGTKVFTKELHRRYHDRGTAAAAFHPGNVASNFARDSQSVLRFISNNPLTRRLMISPEEGASHLVWLAEGTPGKDWQSGVYYEKRKPARRNNKQALDPELARELWERSAALVSAG